MPFFIVKRKDQVVQSTTLSVKGTSSPSEEFVKESRGRPPIGKICEGVKWIDGVKSSEPNEKKPSGQPSEGAIWKNGECIRNEKPQLRFKRMTIGGRTIFLKIKAKPLITEARKKPVIKAIANAETNGVTNAVTKTTKTTIEPKTKRELLGLNKKLHKLLTSGKRSGASELINQGASFAYFNFEGICEAAEHGNIEIFYDIFDNTDFQERIDMDLGNDLMESAKENGHINLFELIKHHSDKFLEKIENQNLAGMNAFNE